MRGYHDLGGLPGGSINPSEHNYQLWEKRTHALLVLLADPKRDLVNVHELRRGIESLGEAEYNRLNYYERWITSISNVLLQKGILTPEELGRKLAEIEARQGEST